MRNLYVDRLRGVAALMVVISHASGYVPLFFFGLPLSLRLSISANGYSGVSIFFTISGFLITSKILASSDEAGSFSISKFYLYRVARILPCLLLMIACACVAALSVPSRFEVDWQSMPQRLWNIFTFRYNVYFTHVGGVPRLWDPLWSLSVEEVFYLCFPAALLLIRSRSLLIAGLLALIVTGPLYRYGTNNPYAYLSNFDGIAMGVIVALVLDKFKSLQPRASILRCSRYLGTSVIAANFLYTRSVYGEAHASLTWGATFMALGAAIYLLGTHKSDTTRSIAFSWLERFGEYSYEIYLFHMFFLLSLADAFKLPFPLADDTIHRLLGNVWMLVLISGLLGFSYFVYTFFSEPVRKAVKTHGERLAEVFVKSAATRPTEKV